MLVNLQGHENCLVFIENGIEVPKGLLEKIILGFLTIRNLPMLNLQQHM